MRRLSFGMAIVALAGLASPAAAADWSLCGTSSNGFLSCASASASASGSTLTVTVNNLYPSNGDAHLVTGFGLYYTGSSLGTATIASPPTGWAAGLGSLANPGPAVSETWLASASTTNGVNNSIGWNSSKVFTFTLSQALTESDLSRLNFAFRAQATGPDGGGSIKCYQTDDIQSEHSCFPVTTTTPEPATMALMGSGLFALAGFGAVRRRRNNQLV